MSGKVYSYNSVLITIGITGWAAKIHARFRVPGFASLSTGKTLRERSVLVNGLKRPIATGPENIVMITIFYDSLYCKPIFLVPLVSSIQQIVLKERVSDRILAHFFSFSKAYYYRDDSKAQYKGPLWTDKYLDWSQWTWMGADGWVHWFSQDWSMDDLSLPPAALWGNESTALLWRSSVWYRTYQKIYNRKQLVNLLNSSPISLIVRAVVLTDW